MVQCHKCGLIVKNIEQILYIHIACAKTLEDTAQSINQKFL